MSESLPPLRCSMLTSLFTPRLTSAHTGAHLAEKLVECLKNFNIHEKASMHNASAVIVLILAIQVFAVTCDNAESNTVMLREMERLLPGLRGLKTGVRCFGHVINLVVKVGPTPFCIARVVWHVS